MAIEMLKKIWAEWQIEDKPLGTGSSGVVYKAVRRDLNVESYAAIKVISIPADSSQVDSLRSEGLDVGATKTYLQSLVKDFISEIQLMESLKGVQNIVSVEDYKVVEKTDEIGWYIFIRMELLTPFNTYLCGRKLTEEDVIKLGCDICSALEICGKRNIIHRDIKPENIFINDFGHFKLGDFGIARKMENMTGGLSQKGTFNYMAPEVAKSSDYDARVDTYSLAVVLYRLLNGNMLPFLDAEKQLLNPNERRNAVDRRIRGEKLPAPRDASPAMADLILRACAYDPDMRFASAAEMKQALMQVANGTYQAANDPDKTTSVRRAPINYDRKPPEYKTPSVSSQTEQHINTFGATPKKNPSRIIAAALAFIILAGAYIFALSKLFDDSADPKKAIEHTHQWSNATCLSPKTCSSCGETIGSALGHNWLNATCMQPGICTECGAEKGDAIGHKWAKATRTAPKTCDNCGATSGSPADIGLFSCPVLEDSNNGGGTTDVSIGNWIGLDGSMHTNATKFWVINYPGWNNTEHILLNIDKNYETLLISLCIARGSENGANAYLRVYLDGKLSATSSTVSGLETGTMTLDVSGASRIRIECITESPQIAYCIVDAWLSIP